MGESIIDRNTWIDLRKSVNSLLLYMYTESSFMSWLECPNKLTLNPIISHNLQRRRTITRINKNPRIRYIINDNPINKLILVKYLSISDCNTNLQFVHLRKNVEIVSRMIFVDYGAVVIGGN
jgi:hypothetical protein